METNHATISHYLHPSLSHTVFTCSGGHWPTGAHKIAPLQFFFFAQILLTCDPRVTNASTRERIRGTFQTSLYRQEKRGLGLRDGVSSSDLVWVIFCMILLALSNVESYSLCSDPLVSL